MQAKSFLVIAGVVPRTTRAQDLHIVGMCVYAIEPHANPCRTRGTRRPWPCVLLTPLACQIATTKLSLSHSQKTSKLACPVAHKLVRVHPHKKTCSPRWPKTSQHVPKVHVRPPCSPQHQSLSHFQTPPRRKSGTCTPILDLKEIRDRQAQHRAQQWKEKL